ncbi:MAG: outer membrane protein assembly factor BamD [Nitrospinota bacterium]|nr:MAG: outer membrane protein assembly factor BamD [Nitrospinota bacterium]
MRAKYAGLLILMMIGGSLFSCAAQRVYNNPADLYRAGNEALSRGKFDEASQYFQRLVEEFPESPFRVEGLINLADALYQDDRFEEAKFQYQKFLQLYPVHPFASKAQFQIGMTAYRRIKTFDRDQSFTREAISAFEKVIQNFPFSPYAEDARKKIRAARQLLARHEMAIADFYYKKGAWVSAIPRYQKILSQYEDAPFLDEVLFKLGQSYFAEENFLKATQSFAQLIQRFPQSPFAREAKARLQELQ